MEGEGTGNGGSDGVGGIEIPSRFRVVVTESTGPPLVGAGDGEGLGLGRGFLPSVPTAGSGAGLLASVIAGVRVCASPEALLQAHPGFCEPG